MTRSRREVSVSGTSDDIKTTCSARKTPGVTNKIEMLVEFTQRDQEKRLHVAPLMGLRDQTAPSSQRREGFGIILITGETPPNRRAVGMNEATSNTHQNHTTNEKHW